MGEFNQNNPNLTKRHQKLASKNNHTHDTGRHKRSQKNNNKNKTTKHTIEFSNNTLEHSPVNRQPCHYTPRHKDGQLAAAPLRSGEIRYVPTTLRARSPLRG